MTGTDATCVLWIRSEAIVNLLHPECGRNEIDSSDTIRNSL
jgi:hypothetical protein